MTQEVFRRLKIPLTLALGLLLLLGMGTIWRNHKQVQQLTDLTENARHVLALDSALRLEVLLLLQGKHANYDHLEALRKSMDHAVTLAEALAMQTGSKQIKTDLSDIKARISDQSVILDDFKRALSLVRNARNVMSSSINVYKHDKNVSDASAHLMLEAEIALSRLGIVESENPKAARSQDVESLRELAGFVPAGEERNVARRIVPQARVLLEQIPQLYGLVALLENEDRTSLMHTFSRDVAAKLKEGERARFMLMALMSVSLAVLGAQFFRRQRHYMKEQRLAASVFAHASEGVMIFDTDKRIVEVNAAFTYITGYSRAEAVGQPVSLLNSGRHDEAFHQSVWQSVELKGRWHGEVWCKRKNGEIYPEALSLNAILDNEGKALNYMGVFSDISELKATQTRLEKLANFDALTELPNRSLLTTRLLQAMRMADRHAHLMGVILLDLDNFKPINDVHGHHMGDRVLGEIARRLEKNLREGDTAARLGGDEFVLIINELECLEDILPILDRVQSAIHSPFSFDGFQFNVSASLGATIYPNDANDPDSLLRQADHAMYLAKQSGRNRYYLFDQDQERQVRLRNELLGRLGEAIGNNELEVYYQPKIELRTGRIYGAEALVRWNDPARGLIEPGAFLPMMQNHDLVIVLDDWVLAEVLRRLEHWHSQGIDLSVSVNIAPRDLLRKDFVHRLKAQVAMYPGLPAGALELEILETAALENTEYVRDVIEQCRQMGLRFSLDDFGTGHASLNYLKQIPADVIKIDQNFVRGITTDPDDLALVQGIIGLSRAFGREVVAEGMETREHGEILARLGCDHAQGYGLARPMPAEQFEVWLHGFESMDGGKLHSNG